MSAACCARASSSDESLLTLGMLDELRLERGFLAAARADTGVEERTEGVRDTPLVDELGDFVWPRGDDPFTVWTSWCSDLVELTGVPAPGLRDIPDIVFLGRGRGKPIDELGGDSTLQETQCDSGKRKKERSSVGRSEGQKTVKCPVYRYIDVRQQREGMQRSSGQ